jgi:hypothetical protein
VRAFESSSRGAGGDEPTALQPRPCPRDATHEEWETWHASLTWEEQLRRGDVDPPEHEYSDADIAQADAREARRRAQRWDPDPFSYAADRRAGPWPRVDQIEVPALSSTWRMDLAGGYSPGGFARRMRQVPYRELIEERRPARAQRDPAARLAWLLEAIEREETSLRAALKRVLRERHGQLAADERGATGCAMAWSSLVASRCQLRALRDLARKSRAEVLRQRSQLTLF